MQVTLNSIVSPQRMTSVMNITGTGQVLIAANDPGTGKTMDEYLLYAQNNSTNGSGLKIEHVDTKEFNEREIRFKKGSVRTQEDSITGILAKDTDISGWLFKSGTEIIFKTNGQVEHGVLAKDTDSDGFLFKAGTEVVFNRAGKLVQGTLVNDTTIGQYVFKAGTAVTLNRIDVFQERIEPLCGVLASDTKIGCWVFPAGFVVKFDTNGDLSSVVLGQDMEIDGYLFRKGTSVEFKDGRMVSGVLAKETKIGKHMCSAGVMVRLGPDGSLIGLTLIQDTMVDGYPFKGGTEVSFNYVDELKGTLARDTEIDGFFFKAGTEFEFGTDSCGVLAQDVQMERCILPAGTRIRYHFYDHKVCAAFFDKDTEINGVLWKKGTETNFTDEGDIWRGTIARDTNIGGYLFKRDTEVELLGTDKVSRGILAQDTEINGYLFAGGTTFQFAYYAMPQSGTLAKDTEIDGHLIKGKTDVHFHYTGKLSQGILAKDMEINGYLMKGGTETTFYDDGTIKTGTLAKDTWVGFHRVRAGAMIYFNKDGSVDSCSEY